MKISQMSTDALWALLARLTPPACRILRDPEVLAAFDSASFVESDRLPPMAAAAMMWERLLPLVLRKHENDVYEVLAALTDKSPEVLKKQKGLMTLKDIQAVWDEELMAFFSYAGAAAQGKS